MNELVLALPREIVEGLSTLRAAEEALKDAKLALKQAAATCPMTRGQLLEVYWSVPEIAVDALLERLGTTAGMARKDGIWGTIATGTCAACSADIVATSRTAALKEPPEICAECRDRAQRAHWEGHDRRVEQRLAELDELRSMPYVDYLQTRHWQMVRQQALRRARWACQVCNAAARLDVHHRTYERVGCEEPADVIALCRPCHARHHGKPA